MYHEYESVDRDRADRREILDRIVIELGHRGSDRHRRRHSQSSVYPSASDLTTVSAASVPLAPTRFSTMKVWPNVREPLRDDARHHIRIAAGGIGDDDPHRARRPRLRLPCAFAPNAVHAARIAEAANSLRRIISSGLQLGEDVTVSSP